MLWLIGKVQYVVVAVTFWTNGAIRIEFYHMNDIDQPEICFLRDFRKKANLSKKECLLIGQPSFAKKENNRYKNTL